MRSRFRSFLALFGVLALGAAGMVALAPAAVAATIGPVDASITDGQPDSLRDVLENQVADGDTVVLQPNATYTLTDCGEDGGALNTSAELTLQGNLATIEQTCDEIVWDMGDDATLDGVTLTGGFDTGARRGGGIHFDGNALTITNSSIVGNATCGNGGGIFMHGGEFLHVENTTIAGNSTNESGGGIGSTGSVEATLEIVNSTISGNTAIAGGGIWMEQGGPVSLVYVTMAGNAADTPGPISECTDSDALNATDARGSADVGAQANGTGANIQFDQPDSVLTTFSSVIALPVEGPNCNVDVEAAPAEVFSNTESHGYNYSDDESCGLTGTGDRQGAADPQLLPLGPNGGPTETRPPAETSPLVDGVPLAQCQADGAAGIATDQRGITRPQRNGCDIGAVELVALTPTPEPAPAAVVTPRFTG